MTEQAIAERPPEAPPSRRPSSNDDAVTRAAAKTFSEEAAKTSPAILEGLTAEEFAEHVLEVLPVWDEDGVELAQAMNRRHGYDVTRDLIDLMAQWQGHVSDARDRQVRAWVASANPVPPFDGVARVRVMDGSGTTEGVAYASPRYTAMGQCLVVVDGDMRHVMDGAFAGGRIIEWERITVTGPATEVDRRRYQASLDAEDRFLERRALEGFVHAREAGYVDALATADKANAKVTDDDLRQGLASLLHELANAVAVDGAEVPPALAAQVVSALQVLRAREGRAAFARTQTGPGQGS